MDCWLKISQIFYYTVVGLAAIVTAGTGVWAYYRWRKERGHETSLEISLDSTATFLRNDLYLVFIDVSLANVGKTKLAAKKKKCKGNKADPVYEDKMETINHSLGLQLRAIRSDIDSSTAIDWFTSKDMLFTPENIGDEINLFADFELIASDEPDEIMIEPGTTNHFGYALILPAGHYLAKVTFIGKRPGVDFWRRLFHIQVQSSQK
jgi:hypothetical protein